MPKRRVAAAPVQVRASRRTVSATVVRFNYSLNVLYQAEEIKLEALTVEFTPR